MELSAVFDGTSCSVNERAFELSNMAGKPGSTNKTAKRKKSKNGNVDDVCGKCNVSEEKTDANEKWVTCFVCDQWNHYKCITESDRVKEVLQEEEDVFIRCENCRTVDFTSKMNDAKQLQRMNDMMTALANENSFLKTEVNGLRSDVAKLMNGYKSFRQEVNNLHPKFDYMTKMLENLGKMSIESRDTIMGRVDEKTDKLVQENER